MKIFKWIIVILAVAVIALTGGKMLSIWITSEYVWKMVVGDAVIVILFIAGVFSIKQLCKE